MLFGANKKGVRLMRDPFFVYHSIICFLTRSFEQVIGFR
jgi:hypothetical protein